MIEREERQRRNNGEGPTEPQMRKADNGEEVLATDPTKL